MPKCVIQIACDYHNLSQIDLVASWKSKIIIVNKKNNDSLVLFYLCVKIGHSTLHPFSAI